MSQQKLQEQQRVQKAFGDQIRNLRLKKAWSQKLLAELSGIDSRSIAQIEHGEFDVRLSTLIALATNASLIGSSQGQWTSTSSPANGVLEKSRPLGSRERLP